ncbi:hypothetical protein BDD21_1417 [Thiocapsa rosea]|uniref:Uncharacterized protein n=1 Tax=Thiocapsa rosea TaxID=69360 RepID=A0A495V3R7_9GAMM|nr:hypothetical protein BDD21_1417 [Thiocapsa rosea]
MDCEARGSWSCAWGPMSINDYDNDNDNDNEDCR